MLSVISYQLSVISYQLSLKRNLASCVSCVRYKSKIRLSARNLLYYIVVVLYPHKELYLLKDTAY